MRERLTISRIVIHLSGMMLLALGIAASLRSDLGSAPVSSMPYMLNLTLGTEFGLATNMFMCVFLLIQVFILRRDFKPYMVLQLLVGFLFGYMNTLAVWIVSFLPEPQTMVTRLIFTCAGFLVGGFGVWLFSSANVLQMPTDGLCIVIAEKLNKPFHVIKVCFDVSNVSLALICSLIFLGSLGSVGLGTVIIAIMQGTMVGVYKGFWGKNLDALFAKDKPLFPEKTK